MKNAVRIERVTDEYSVIRTPSNIQSIPYNTIAKHLNVIAYFEIRSRLTTLEILLWTTY